ncbi:hypothetical protein [Erythrobacter sp. MTPC3]|uniref:hypothetical protein n=1 Tax=Erythrobacter sp. MTPC3 TaxID=3056564 RepID=UPI0036F2C001
MSYITFLLRTSFSYLLRTSFSYMNFSEPDSTPFEFSPKNTGLKFRLSNGEPRKQFQETQLRTTFRAKADLADVEFVRALRNKAVTRHPCLPFDLPFSINGTEIIDKDCRLVANVGFRRRWLPKSIDNFLEESITKLQLETDRFLGLLRWGEGLTEVPSLDELSTWIGWRTPRTRLYHLIPQKFDPQTGLSTPFLRSNTDLTARFKYFWDNQVEEPLGHALLHQASRTVERNPRAALLMCASALETGLKSHISSQVPEAEWLAINVPSPPIYRIVKDYLPELHSQNEDINWGTWKNHVKAVQQLFEDRNRLAHKGAFTEEVPVHEYITVCSDILYLCDFLRGKHWACNHMSTDVGSPLGKEQDKRVRFTVQDPYDIDPRNIPPV